MERKKRREQAADSYSNIKYFKRKVLQVMRGSLGSGPANAASQTGDFAVAL